MTADPVIRLDVAGKPVPQGSKKAGRHGGIYETSAKTLAPWRALIAAATREAITKRRRPGDRSGVFYPAPQPVQVEITFLMPRPAGHYTRAAQATMRPGAPRKPAIRPDIDKLTRAVLDALKTGGAYADDGQVTDLAVLKRYATGATLPAGGAHIEICGA